jgi:transposase-like protein
MVTAVFRTAFAQPDAEVGSHAWDQVRDQLDGTLPNIGSLMDEAKTEVLAFTGSHAAT